jgi:hypothetical protein
MKTRSSTIFRLAPLTLVTLASLGGGCLTRPIAPLDTRTTWDAQLKQTRSGVDKIDLLLMIDNSTSMADKQALLAEAVPQLVRGLLLPACIGTDGKPLAAAAQPKSPIEACPAGSAREFEPVTDVHIGIVSSSLGDYGAGGKNGACPGATKNDAAHLVSRTDATTPDTTVQTYQGKGFLAWDPKQKLTPPGEGDLDATIGKLTEMVGGTGQIGCGFEASLESWYRFLVEPEPYDQIGLTAAGTVATAGADGALLAERAAFLRPDSLVAILMLTDENDCSVAVAPHSARMLDIGRQMPRARAVCEQNPNDHCCAPCDETPTDCPTDPSCATDGGLLKAADDPAELRCWDQKRRFGKDYLYPAERYVAALTQAQVQKRDGAYADNPLFPADPDGTRNARKPGDGLVFLAGIVGVPWQDIARIDADGKPNLVSGRDKEGNAVGGFMSSEELLDRDATLNGATRWDVILGDPANRVPPLDPLMIESRKERSGTNPITGTALQPSSASSPSANPINGHEWNGDAKGGDLQYACIFELKQADQRDCSVHPDSCACSKDVIATGDNPLCQDAATGQYTSVQRRAKGYPGTRHLEVIKGLGDQGVVASVCPSRIDDTTARDYGYSPAIGAIVERLKKRIGGQCLTQALKPDADGQVACVVIEASKSDGGQCCTQPSRRPVDAKHAHAAELAKADPSAAGDDCFCEIDQLADEDLRVCQTSPAVVPVDGAGQAVDGWCYVSDATGSPNALLTSCSTAARYRLRFVGSGQPAPEAVAFITCAGGE